MVIRNGFGRAMSAIVDSNVTTIISGIVLYLFGTDQVKGFAVTLDPRHPHEHVHGDLLSRG